MTKIIKITSIAIFIFSGILITSKPDTKIKEIPKPKYENAKSFNYHTNQYEYYNANCSNLKS